MFPVTVIMQFPLEEKGSFSSGGRRSAHSAIVGEDARVSQSPKKHSSRLIAC